MPDIHGKIVTAAPRRAHVVIGVAELLLVGANHEAEQVVGVVDSLVCITLVLVPFASGMGHKVWVVHGLVIVHEALGGDDECHIGI